MTKQQRPLPQHVETCLFDLDDCLYRNPEFPRDMAINIQSEEPPRPSAPPHPSASRQLTHEALFICNRAVIRTCLYRSCSRAQNAGQKHRLAASPQARR